MGLPTIFREAWRFGRNGSLGFVFGVVLLYVLTEYVGLWYVASAAIAQVGNYAATFLIHKLVTFGDRTTRRLKSQMTWYAVMVSGFYVTNLLMLPVLVEWLGMWYMAAQVLIAVVLTAVSFLVSRKLYASKSS